MITHTLIIDFFRTEETTQRGLEDALYRFLETAISGAHDAAERTFAAMADLVDSGYEPSQLAQHVLALNTDDRDALLLGRAAYHAVLEVHGAENVWMECYSPYWFELAEYCLSEAERLVADDSDLDLALTTATIWLLCNWQERTDMVEALIAGPDALLDGLLA